MRGPFRLDVFPVSAMISAAVLSHPADEALILLLDGNSRVGSFSHEGDGRCLYWSDAKGAAIEVKSLCEAVSRAECEVISRRGKKHDYTTSPRVESHGIPRAKEPAD